MVKIRNQSLAALAAANQWDAVSELDLKVGAVWARSCVREREMEAQGVLPTSGTRCRSWTSRWVVPMMCVAVRMGHEVKE